MTGRFARLLNRLERIVDGIFVGTPNTHRLPFRPTWDERRLDSMHVIDRDDVKPPFPPPPPQSREPTAPNPIETERRR